MPYALSAVQRRIPCEESRGMPRIGVHDVVREVDAASPPPHRRRTRESLNAWHRRGCVTASRASPSKMYRMYQIYLLLPRKTRVKEKTKEVIEKSGTSGSLEYNFSATSRPRPHDALVDRCTALLRAKGIHFLNLHLRTDAPRAIRFWESNGFTGKAPMLRMNKPLDAQPR